MYGFSSIVDCIYLMVSGYVYTYRANMTTNNVTINRQFPSQQMIVFVNSCHSC